VGSRDLTELMHTRGINMRYLGRLVLDCKHNFAKELAVREVLARSVKVLIRDGLSFLREQATGTYEQDCKKLII